VGYPPSNDPFGAELRRLAENLDRGRIRAVSPGLGIGKVTKSANAHLNQAPIHYPETRFSEAQLAALAQLPEAPSRRPAPFIDYQLALSEAIRPQGGRGLRLLKLVAAHSLDLFVVGLSLFATLVVMGYWLAPASAGFSLRNLGGWMPFRLLLQSSLLSVIFSLYVLFLFYWGLFKLITGETLGQSCVEVVAGERRQTQQRRSWQ